MLLQQSRDHLVGVLILWMKNRPVTFLGRDWDDQRWLLWWFFYLTQFQICWNDSVLFKIQQWHDMTYAEYSQYILLLSTFWIKMFNVIHFYIIWNVFLVPVTSKWTEIQKNTTSREEHQWIIMWQCASYTVILNEKINIQIYSSPRFFYRKGKNIIIMPK